MADQDFVAPWNGKCEPPPTTVVPTLHFRLKAGVLQQLCGSTGGGRRWWINVQAVGENEPDVMWG